MPCFQWNRCWSVAWARLVRGAAVAAASWGSHLGPWWPWLVVKRWGPIRWFPKIKYNKLMVFGGIGLNINMFSHIKIILPTNFGLQTVHVLLMDTWLGLCCVTWDGARTAWQKLAFHEHKCADYVTQEGLRAILRQTIDTWMRFASVSNFSICEIFGSLGPSSHADTDESSHLLQLYPMHIQIYM